MWTLLAYLAAAGPTERVLVEVDGPVGHILPVGARPLGPGTGGIWVIDLPISARQSLATASGVRATSRGGTLRPVLDRSIDAIGMRALRRTLGEAADGAGAVVGVVDTGIDALHPDLLGPDGRPRVGWIADLSEAPRGIHPGLEALVDAAVYGPDEIAHAVARSDPSVLGGRDRIGHGTHVAAIAAGNDGAAPGATLVVVKASREEEGRFDEADVVLATRFCFAVADQLGLPAVVNLSLGGDDGAHDGTSLLERGLVASLDERPAGRAIVVAAGNGAYRDGHASAWLAPGESIALTLAVPRASSASQAAPKIRIVAVGAATIEVVPPSEGSGGSVRIDRVAPDQVAIELESPTPGRWNLVLGGAGRADAWLAETDLVGPLGSRPRFVDHVDPGGQVSLPATAEGLVAVGSWASRVEYRDRDGAPHRTPSRHEGEVSVFSARGPTRDGRPKPDLVAPGEAIVAALSADFDPEDPRSAFHRVADPFGALVDDDRAVLWGTSAAAAHVSGLAAVLLAARPEVEADRLAGALIGSADPREDHAWSPAYGWGAVNGPGALALIDGSAAAFDPAASRMAAVPDVAAPGERVRVLVSLRTADGGAAVADAPPSVVAQPGGTPVAVTALGNGRYEGAWTAPASALGRAIVFEAAVQERALGSFAQVEVTERREDLGARERLQGGGCRTASAATGRDPLLLLLLLLGASLLARN